ncbi:type VI secretion system-associated FHA domain protein TagH [Accumulibacter sp.]|uniref:type VI secretion system-associated FHA domain protein TagH n=1 Tax=Accumulibacter sp. TaxID=2053492 RepID=UPI002603C1E3|nr:type VI secretion system-associated FHA domain protein TagH [Accumulibacter sp.]
MKCLRLTLENATGLPADADTGIDFGDRECLAIGRLTGLDWTLPDPSRLMSGRHCEIRRSADSYLLYDLSTNGTFIDGSPTRLSGPHNLRDGERLRIGAYVVRVELSGGDEQPAADERTRLIGATAAEPWLELTVDNKPGDLQPPAVRLGRQGMLKIGRDDNADWTLPDRTGGVSRDHCSIRFADGAFLLEDRSANGTFVNGGSERITSAYRLSDGDRLLIGSYLIAVRISGLPRSVPPTGKAEEQAPASPPEAVSSPPPAAARPRGSARRGGDPAATLADLPAIPVAAAGGSDAAGAKAAPGDDGVTRLARVPKKPAATTGEVQTAKTGDAGDADRPPAETGDEGGSRGEGRSPAAATADDRFLAAVANALGLSPADIGETDAAALGGQLAELVLLLTDEIRQLLVMRDASVGPPSGVRAGTSNPLAIMPTNEEALRVLFGPPRRAFLDSRQAFQASLDELRQHFRQIDAAVRVATRVLSKELAPEAIDQAASAESFIGQLLSSRKARLWDIYVERWNSRAALQPEQPVRSFLQTFGGASLPGDDGKTA